jgi:hypothetical protein
MERVLKEFGGRMIKNDYLIKILGKKEKRVALVVVKELPLQYCESIICFLSGNDDSSTHNGNHPNHPLFTSPQLRLCCRV